MKKTLNLLFDRNGNYLEGEKSSVPIKTTFVEKKR